MDTVPPMSYPRNGGSPVYGLPLQPEGPSPFFPAMCLKSHWDPTAINRLTLPDQYVGLPTDPRPWTRICLEYTTAGDDQPAPAVPANVVMPTGGQFYPPTRYSAAIDQESQLRRLDRPLGTCEKDQWEPSATGDMFDARVLVPRNAPPSDPAQIQEIAYPAALLRSGPYPCRAEADAQNVRLSSEFVFNNATKQDRYRLMKKDARPAAPASPLQASKIPIMKPDVLAAAGPAMRFPAPGPVPTATGGGPAPP